VVVERRIRDWVAEACGEPVRDAEPVSGGAASLIDFVHLASGRTVVLRRVPVEGEVPNHDPAAEIRNEASALRLLQGHSWVPTLLAADPDGERCGVAASLQTLLPGRVWVEPSEAWLDSLESAIRAVADLAVAPTDLASFKPWLSQDLRPPSWASNPAPWKALQERLRGWEPAGDRLIHRDLHSGNILRDGAEFSGVVDWVHGCRGPLEADFSRCCVEVHVIAGAPFANALRERCVDLFPDYDHRWDLLVAAELAPWASTLLGFNASGARLDLPDVHQRLQEVVEQALVRLDA
jgi:aminoglycoside phosphotransferase (APT) family kinase protein